MKYKDNHLICKDQSHLITFSAENNMIVSQSGLRPATLLSFSFVAKIFFKFIEFLLEPLSGRYFIDNQDETGCPLRLFKPGDNIVCLVASFGFA